MNCFEWLIVLIPLVCVYWLAFYSKRYVRDVSDYLACGRVAGRFVIAVGSMSSTMSVILVVSSCEQAYQCGYGVNFWRNIIIPISLLISLTGFCSYRFRATKCLSGGQFLEMRYSRSFRIVAMFMRTMSEMLTNAIGPAVAVRFFIYFIGLPHRFNLFGLQCSTYTVLMIILLLAALVLIWPSGRISLLITDAIQGILSYPIYVLIVVFILVNASWFNDIVPALLDRVPGESFLNPYDVSKLRDFNLFSVIVVMMNSVMEIPAWYGNDNSGAGRTPHEQKMAGIIGTFRSGFCWLMIGLITYFVISFMSSPRFESVARAVRMELSEKIVTEILPDNSNVRHEILEAQRQMPLPGHLLPLRADGTVDLDKMGDDEYRQANSWSRERHPDVDFISTARNVILDSSDIDRAESNLISQKYRTLYYQMMMPMVMRHMMPSTIAAFFILLMLMLLLSTDDSRIFNASAAIIQDLVVPFLKKPLTHEQHLKCLKFCSVGVVIFFFVASLFLSQIDFIAMFCTIMMGIWLGGAGPIMIGGLYTRFGTTTGAWCAMIFGSGTSICGLILQQHWAKCFYPLIVKLGWLESIDKFLQTVSAPFNPFVVWSIGDGEKFPINSWEIYFLSMVIGISAYVIGSLVTCRSPYNLDRLLHRGQYADSSDTPQQAIKNIPEGEASIGFVRGCLHAMSKFIGRIVGITPEYSRGDRILAWVIFYWSFVYGFVIYWCGIIIWNMISPWPDKYWAYANFWEMGIVMLLEGMISTVWFMWGGIRDVKAMFKALDAKVTNQLDNGMVVNGVALADKERFDKIDCK